MVKNINNKTKKVLRLSKKIETAKVHKEVHLKKTFFKRLKDYIANPLSRFLNFVLQRLKSLGNFIATIIILIIIVNLTSCIGNLFSKKDTQDKILIVNLDKGVEETPEESIFLIGEDEPYVLRSLARKIELAGQDEKVKAIIFKGEDNLLGLSSIEEIKNALKKYNESGKKSIYFAKTFGGGMSNGMSEYYLATSLKEIWMESNSSLNLLGIGIEKPYYKDTFDKVNIKPVFSKRHEHKTSPNTYLRNSASKEEIEFTKTFSKDIYNMMVSEISKKRGVSKAIITKSINKSPLTEEEALKLKLIDKVITRIDFNEKIEELYSDEIAKVDISNYYPDLKDFGYKMPKKEKTILSINIDGVIIDGTKDDISPGYVVSEPIVSSIYEEVKNETIDGIVVRVNSPGGSYDASNDIYKALMWAKEQGIPVFVSQGNYAASGGYFISIASDKIFANKGTITGSIGVYSGKFIGTEELWQALGINWYRHSIGKNAGMGSVVSDFTESQKVAFERSLDLVYKDFTNKVSKSRGIPLKELDKVARGRVWLGADALENNLVDGIADYVTVINHMKERLGLKSKDLVGLKVVPAIDDDFQQIKKLIGKTPSIKSAIKKEIGIDNSFSIWLENFFTGQEVKMISEPIMIDM